MSTADRMTMIEGMVSGLAEKLQSEPKNLAGWNRLIRSYSVLGKRDLAREAYQSAVAAFADDPTVIAQLESLAGNLELLPVAPQNGETKKEDSPLTRRTNRLMWIAAIGLVMALAVGLSLYALRSGISFALSPQ